MEGVTYNGGAERVHVFDPAPNDVEQRDKSKAAAAAANTIESVHSSNSKGG